MQGCVPGCVQGFVQGSFCEVLASCGGGLFGVYEIPLGQDIQFWYLNWTCGKTNEPAVCGTVIVAESFK